MSSHSGKKYCSKEREVPQSIGQVSKPGRPRVRNEGLWSVGLVARKDILQVFVGVMHLSKLPSLSGKSLPREGRRPVEAQTDQLNVPSLSVTLRVSYRVKGVVGVVDIEFIVNTGAAVSLIRKDVWTPLVKRDNALVLEQYSGKKLVGVSGVYMRVRIVQVLLKGSPFWSLAL